MKITKEQAQKIIERYEEAEEDDDEYMGFGQSASAIKDVLEILNIQHRLETTDYRNWKMIILNEGDSE